jgi:hypothetical protein
MLPPYQDDQLSAIVGSDEEDYVQGMRQIDLEPHEYGVRGKKEPVFQPGGFLRLLVGLLVFAAATAWLYFTKYQYY